jgi:uncharacterized membrane protein YdjX (TVP38/TMEM64 family)
MTPVQVRGEAQFASNNSEMASSLGGLVYRSCGTVWSFTVARLPASAIVNVPKNDPHAGIRGAARRGSVLRRLLPVILLGGIAVLVLALGWHRELSLETLVRHRVALEALVSEHFFAALAAFIALYIAVVALSVPGAVYLTISSGILFGAVVGGLASIIGATIGATALFLVARTALGELLARRAGPLAERIAAGFREDAFSYLLFLRLVPAFPFFLVNLAPALVGVKLSVFVAATVIGVIPATFAFAFLGSGLDSVIAAQERIFRACLATGRTDCEVSFDLGMIATPQLLASLAVLGVIALIPVVVKRMRARNAASRPARLS